MTTVHTVISGGQDGADVAGLAAGLLLGLNTGGYIPKGRRTDSGQMAYADFVKYRLKEHESASYPPRTRSNVIWADATVLFGNMHSPGCSLTLRLCKQYSKPALTNPTAEQLRCWIEHEGVNILNVAGNRERTNPGIYQLTYDTLIEALR